MSFVNGLIKVAKGATVGVAAVTALPIFGAAGTITAVGITVGAVVGATAGVLDEIIENTRKSADSKRESS